ncbi:MBL fold metallo-hydrolase [Desulfovermiculus halophilus]|jgi:glyoxylase-like metal-dependent hydrolase (beta-lactamase superfamily II)|uniref:MBL fold metallo-hydrolase n=1 Tax=Desulfovermiculus halophilus TaxID=339722 RepID=UPI000A81CF9A|nr:MBL fold metallo-hydrolase [Desulfovermiculus halophilus]
MIDVHAFPLGPLQTNCFVAVNGSKALAIDPGGDPTDVVGFLSSRGLSLEAIVNTHFHFDHILGNTALQEATKAPIYGPKDDDFLLKAQEGGGGMMGFPKVPSFEYQPLEPGEHEFVGDRCVVMHTPGHTPGSMSLYFADSKVLFVGDLIFQGSIGRTDFPGGSLETLLQGVREKVFTLPGETVIYPGHGPQTTVESEKQYNPFFREGAFF